MQKNEMKLLINNVISAWGTRDIDNILKHYDKNLALHVNDLDLQYADLVNRAKFAEDKLGSIKTEIKDMIIEGDKISVRLVQTLIEKLSNKATTYQIMGIYQTQNNKITEMWINIYPPVDYQEKA